MRRECIQSPPELILLLGGRVTRKWSNEEAILTAAAEAGFALNVADFAKMSFADQLNIVRRSAVLIGIHGAALTHAMFMAPGSVLFEIPALERGRHFENLAVAANLTYAATSFFISPPPFLLCR